MNRQSPVCELAGAAAYVLSMYCSPRESVGAALHIDSGGVPARFAFRFRLWKDQSRRLCLLTGKTGR